MKKFRSDKLREECGIFGVSNHEDASALVTLGLHALQHRGQEGCGIVSYDGKNSLYFLNNALATGGFSLEIVKNYKLV